MERKLLEEMLDLAKREKARWDRYIREINAELNKEEARALVSAPRRVRSATSKTAKAEKLVWQILDSADEPMRPKQIVEKAQEMGKSVRPNLVRQILSRSKNDKFVSPERGLWTLKKTANEKAEG